MKKLFQVVAKWHYSNRIAIYEFREIEDFIDAVKKLEQTKGVTILTTNIALVKL